MASKSGTVKGEKEPKVIPSLEEADEVGALRRHAQRGAAVLVVMIALSRLLGLVREMVIAYRFGAGRETDVYNAAFVLPEFFYYLVAGGVIITAYLPLFTEYRTRQGPWAAWEFFQVVVSVFGLVGAMAIGWGMALTPWFVPLVFPEFDAAQVRDTVRLTLIVFPAQFFFLVGAIFYGTLNAHQRFFLPALGPILYNLAIILGALLAGAKGVEGMAWGVLLGAFVGQVGLQVPALRALGASFRFRFRPSHEGLRRMVALLVPVVFGLSILQFNVNVNRVFAQGLGEGAITWLQYANRLMQLPVGIFASGVAMGIFPALSHFASQAQMEALRGTLAAAFRSVLYLTLPSTMLMAVLAEPIVRLLFQHGLYFDAEDTRQTAAALLFYALGIPAASSQQVLTRGFYALQDTRTPMLAGLLAFGANLVLNLLLRSPLGHRGLALGASLANWLSMLMLAWLLRPRLGGLEGRKLLQSLKGIFVGLTALAALALLVQGLLEPKGDSPLWLQALQVLLAGGAGLAVYGLATLVLGVPEAIAAWRKVQRLWAQRC